MSLLNTVTGDISFKEENGKLTHLTWGSAYEKDASSEKIKAELSAYFNGKQKNFETPLAPEGTELQMKVWDYLLTIPYGEVRTYKDVAQAVGSHPRAVGTAVGKNPMPIVIPCHRVIASNGKMCGFSGGEGIKTKEILLDLEKRNK